MLLKKIDVKYFCVFLELKYEKICIKISRKNCKDDLKRPLGLSHFNHCLVAGNYNLIP